MLALVGAMAAPALCLGATIEEVEAQIKEAYGKLKTYSATVKSETNIKQPGHNMSMSMSGQFEAMNVEGGKNKYRLEGKSKMKMEGMEEQPGMGEQEILIVCDGEFTYQMQTMMGMKNAVKTKADADAIPWAQQRDEYDFTVKADEKVDGQDCWAVEAKAKSADAAGLSRMEFFVRKDTGTMVKQVAFDGEGNPVNTTTFTDVKVNPDVSADRFKWEAPEGVTVMDRTGTPE